MPTFLRVRVPDQPEQMVPLPERVFVVGRSDSCDLQVLEKKASKRHLQLEPAPPGSPPGVTWVVTDLQSSNGTVVAGERILRRGLVAGDVIRLGDTAIEVMGDPDSPASAAPAAAPAPAAPAAAGPVVVLSGLLAAPPTPASAAAPAALPAPDAVGVESLDALGEDAAAFERQAATDARRANEAGRKAITRGAFVLAAGIGTIVLAQVLAGGVAERRAGSRDERAAYAKILADRAGPFEILDAEITAFEGAYPGSPLRTDLSRLRDARRSVHERRQRAESELDGLQRNSAVLPDSDVLGRLIEIRTTIADDASLSRRVQIAIDEVARRREETALRDRFAAEGDVDRALARGDAGAALDRLKAFRASHPGLSETHGAKVSEKEAAARAVAKTLADRALAKAKEAADPDVQRALLAEALRGLAETDEGDRLRGAIASLGGGLGAVPGSGAGSGSPAGSGPGTGPAIQPTALQALLAEAADAEHAAHERRWDVAAAAFTKLAASGAAPRLKQEWAERASDLGRIAALLQELVADVAAAADHPIRVPLSGGIFDVLSADATSVKLRRGEKEMLEAWKDVAVPDLLALLSRGKATPDRHLGLAILAADLGERKAAVDHLLPLVELESHRDLAFQVVARRLEGRTSVPQGGYVALDGDLVDKAEYGRRVEAKHVASLRTEAGTLVEKIASEPAFRKVAALRAKRDELDRRRAYALLAIFNETHWPYPHPASISGPYEAVWIEIVKRTKSVLEVWEDPMTVKVPRTGELAKHLDRHAVVVKELEAKGIDTQDLRRPLEPYQVYVGDTNLSIRTFYRDAEEKTRLAYNRWVMEVYNPSLTDVISAPEREEVRITNEYRMLMGYALRVAPGPDPLQSIEPRNVVSILDKAHEIGRVPLYAVRIDDRLVHSARNHSLDMVKHGYFAHQAPNEPGRSDDPGSTPFDRMAKAGYTGGSASENIAGAGSPQGAHDGWLHSSGHHRNILSDWADLGVGQAGMDWTQNFGNGGGAPTEVPGAKTPTDSPTTPGEGDEGK